MKLEQKKFSNRHSFNFEDAYFNFAYRDKSGSGDFNIPYIDFPAKSQTQIEQNEWLRNAGYIWCVIGLLQFGYAISVGDNLSGKGFWLVVGIICLLAFYLTKVRYSVFRTGNANVFVIQNDPLHDQIVNEIKTRKKRLLIDRYGEIDSDNTPENEIEKFRWLHEQEAMTQAEADKKIAQVEFRHRVTDSQSSLI